jgi:hypothetical protein
MFESFAKSGRFTLYFARYEAIAAGDEFIRPDHLLLAVRGLHPEMACLVEPIRLPPDPTARPRPDLPLHWTARDVLHRATDHARDLWRRATAPHDPSWDRGYRVDARHILVALLELRNGNAAEVRNRLFGAEPLSILPVPHGLPAVPHATAKLEGVLLCAQYEATQSGSSAVRPEHLLAGMAFVTDHTFDPIGKVRAEIGALGDEPRVTAGGFDAECQQALADAIAEAAARKHQQVGTAHLTLALLRGNSGFAKRYLARLGFGSPPAPEAFSGWDL